MGGKTAVVIIHGIGEQIPMDTLKGFVDSVWTRDEALIDRNRPDPDTGGPRTRNAFWSKPDRRCDSFELRRITTEETKTGRRVDFFEYYWAHRVTNTTWAHVRSWLLDLMLRNPFKRVPSNMRPAWATMWAFTLTIAGLWLWWLLNDPGHDSPSVLAGIGLAIASFLLPLIMAKAASHIGDVPRYVKAKPENIAIRESVRRNGVRLLESLMGLDEQGNWSKPKHDRIIVVGHSLGTIVGYDILTHAFARQNARLSEDAPSDLRQPRRADLEALIRTHLKTGDALPLEQFRELQDACRQEMQELGGVWTVSDFITLGSPLAHAEFLMAHDRTSLEEDKSRRILPTCPPTLEYDRTTKKRHFSYHPPSLKKFGSGEKETDPRFPHHAALFAYTKWTNFYSPHRWVIWGDLISGPICKALGLSRGKQIPPLCGVDDIAVLPSETGEPADTQRRIFTHLKYWADGIGGTAGKVLPYHIGRLRKALRLGQNA